MNSQVAPNTLVDEVVRNVREMILAGEIGPGEFLPSRKELAAHFGVGISTVHEAVQALTAVGLLASRPGKGTWVRRDAFETLIHPAALETRLGELEARQLCEARAVIEVALSEFAARRATDAETQRIWAALAWMESALDDDETFVEADMAFHIAVARAGHNDLLEQFYYLSRKLLAATIGELIRLPRVKEDALVIQRRIAAAIAAGDAAGARQAALDHMDIIERLLSDAVHANERQGVKK
ncbi:MAG: FCD domain-containing protein [Anaerolineae bacterium]|jgi:GntR family transcriptional repressor for pyruvate dehydrogenase complex